MTEQQRRVAIITGAGAGVGAHCARELSEAMYRVVLVGRRGAPLRETGSQLGAEGEQWIAVVGDVSEPDARRRVIDETLRGFGRLDALVNNAALGTCKVLGELDDKEIRALFEVNAIGPTELTRAALPHLLASSGCVVNIGSVAAIDPFAGLGVYGCTKAAIDGLTRCLHNEYGSVGLRAYTVAPGAVETAMLRAIVSRDDLPSDQTLSPDEVATVVVDCVLGERKEPSGSTIVIEP